MDLFEPGEAFRLARIGVRKTQQQVAEQSGVTRARISRFETGVLPELGTVKLLSLFEAVGLDLFARPIGAPSQGFSTPLAATKGKMSAYRILNIEVPPVDGECDNVKIGV